MRQREPFCSAAGLSCESEPFSDDFSLSVELFISVPPSNADESSSAFSGLLSPFEGSPPFWPDTKLTATRSTVELLASGGE